MAALKESDALAQAIIITAVYAACAVPRCSDFMDLIIFPIFSGSLSDARCLSLLACVIGDVHFVRYRLPAALPASVLGTRK